MTAKSSENVPETHNAHVSIMVCLKFDQAILIYTCCQKLMKSMGSNGRFSLLFMVKVMV
jgi:hypothetical protein